MSELHSMKRKICRGLYICLFALVSQTGCSTAQLSQPMGEKPSIVVEQLVSSSQSWDGAMLPAYPNGQPKISILRIKIPAGARLDPHLHPVINAGVMVKGELTVVTSEGKTLVLKAGDPIVEVVNTPHFGMNQGGSTAEIIVFYAGSLDVPLTVTLPK